MAVAKTAQQDSLQTIQQFLATVGATKSGEAKSEAGSQGGETSHPVKDVDDRLEDAQEGERSAENSQDVVDDQGQASVDATSESKSGLDEGSASEDQMQIGTEKKPTGEDPENETSSAKPGKEDGQYEGSSTHPARTDNDSLDGHKWASLSDDDLSNMPLSDLANLIKDAGDTLLADIVNEQSDDQSKQAADQSKQPDVQSKQATDQKTETDKPAGTKQAAEVDQNLANHVGWELASLISGNFDKKAADSLVQSFVSDIVKDASSRADAVYEYLHNYQKAAEGGEYPDESGESNEAAEGPAGDADTAGAAPPAGPPAAPAGPPPEDPGAAAAAPPEAGGGEGDQMAMLEEILAELGISPEELMAAIAEQGGGGMPPDAGGGMPPDAGGGLPPEPGMGDAGAVPAEGMEAAGLGGKAASDADTQSKKAAVKSHIQELVGRSRQKQANKATK